MTITKSPQASDWWVIEGTALNIFKQICINDKKGGKSELLWGPWEINFLCDFFFECLKLPVECFKEIVWISETYYRIIKEKKVDQGKSMRIKGNKCVDIKNRRVFSCINSLLVSMIIGPTLYNSCVPTFFFFPHLNVFFMLSVCVFVYV